MIVEKTPISTKDIFKEKLLPITPKKGKRTIIYRLKTIEQKERIVALFSEGILLLI